MRRYDIVFIGHPTTAIVVPFEGPTVIEQGCLAFYTAMAASCLPKKLALVTKMPMDEEHILAPLKTAGIDIYLRPGAGSRVRVMHPKPNVDERKMILEQPPGHFCIEDLPPLEPCLIHLGGFGDQEFPMEFLQSLKERGFRLSADIQSFIWQVDDQTHFIQPKDISHKQEILRMVDFMKFDVFEAKVLTGTDDIHEQAAMLEKLGSAETLITSANGALACYKGESHFCKFTNKNILGRTGRGDTFCGAYLVRRLDHSLEDSLKFAVALTSIKMESPGPFKGTLEDVSERMRQEM